MLYQLPHERNIFNEEIKNYFEEIDFTAEIDEDTNNLIDEFDTNEPDNNSFEYINNKFNNLGLKLKPKLIKSKIRETYDMPDDKISQIMKMIIELEKMRKLDNLYKMKIKKLTDENLNIEEIEKYKNKKKNLDILYLNFPDNINKEIDTLTEEDKKILEEEIKKYLLDDQINNEIDEDTNKLIDEFESNNPDDNFFEYVKTKFPEKEFNIRPKLINSKITETYDMSDDKISQIIKMIIELEKMRKLDNLYKMKIKKLTDENLNIEEIEKYKNKKKNLDILYLNFPDNINKEIDTLTEEDKKILEEEIKKYLLDDQINNEIDEDTNKLIDEFESNNPDDNFFEYMKTKFPEKEFNVRPKPINSKIRESHEILNDKISQIMKMIIELEKTRKINNLYDRKIKKITSQLGDIQSKTSTLNPLNENDEIIRNQLEVKDLTQKYNQYKTKQKYIIEKINALSQKLNSKIDELTDEEKKILEEEIRKYLSLEEYSMSDYLHDKYKEITENIKKWIELTGTSIRNQIELNDWMKKLKNLKEENETTQSHENLKIMEEIKKITDSLKEGIKESKTKIGNLISQMTEKEKNNIEIMEEDINKKKMDNIKNRYMNALRLVQNIESGILSLSS